MLLGFGLAAAFYLLLIDTTDLPELYAGVGAALLSAILFELSCQQELVEISLAASALRHAWRVVVRAPVDIVVVSRVALAQLVRRQATRGVFRAVPFEAGGERGGDAGRRALAEALGSLTPNTIVLGVDVERDLLLVHQLHRAGGREQLDVLELG